MIVITAMPGTMLGILEPNAVPAILDAYGAITDHLICVKPHLDARVIVPGPQPPYFGESWQERRADIPLDSSDAP